MNEATILILIIKYKDYMKKFLSCLVFALLTVGVAQTAKAAPGDTTLVRAHDAVDMVWYETYKAWAVFPNTGTSYHRVNLNLTLGCASTGCSDWDYTVIVWLLDDQGERIEVAKMITPYGAYMRTNAHGYNSSWTHKLVYDVTDFQVLLSDSVEFEVQYQGWSSGFAITLDFEMIEGIPARNVHKVSKVWQSLGGSYANPTAFNNTQFGEQTIQLDNNTVYSWLRMSPSGHGFVNNQNCAEFCVRDYYVKVNGQTIATQSMWRDDCGLNPIWPQGGTWLYNRANWCPGGKVFSYDHPLTPHHTGQQLDLNFDIQNYTVTVPAGETPPTYFVGNVLFEADGIAHQNDVELMEVLAPSQEDDFKRMNPLCGKVIVKIRNKGEQPLTSCRIRYQFNGGGWYTHNWTGSLDFFEEEIVEIPTPIFGLWEFVAGLNAFTATADLPNGQTDEYLLNSTATSIFQNVEVFPRKMFLTVRTNSVGSDTWWKVTRLDDGVVVADGDGLASNTMYYDTLDLGAGCYELVVGDRSGNGLGWWANNLGSGLLRLQGYGGVNFFRNLPLDFGQEYRKYFVVSSSVSSEEVSPLQTLMVYPNPSDGSFVVEAAAGEARTWHLALLDLQGKVVAERTVEKTIGIKEQWDLTLPSGLYFLRLSTPQDGVTTTKIQITR